MPSLIIKSLLLCLLIIVLITNDAAASRTRRRSPRQWSTLPFGSYDAERDRNMSWYRPAFPLQYYSAYENARNSPEYDLANSVFNTPWHTSTYNNVPYQMAYTPSGWSNHPFTIFTANWANMMPYPVQMIPVLQPPYHSRDGYTGLPHHVPQTVCWNHFVRNPSCQYSAAYRVLSRLTPSRNAVVLPAPNPLSAPRDAVPDVTSNTGSVASPDPVQSSAGVSRSEWQADLIVTDSGRGVPEAGTADDIDASESVKDCGSIVDAAEDDDRCSNAAEDDDRCSNAAEDDDRCSNAAEDDDRCSNAAEDNGFARSSSSSKTDLNDDEFRMVTGHSTSQLQPDDNTQITELNRFAALQIEPVLNTAHDDITDVSATKAQIATTHDERSESSSPHALPLSSTYSPPPSPAAPISSKKPKKKKVKSRKKRWAPSTVSKTSSSNDPPSMSTPDLPVTSSPDRPPTPSPDVPSTSDPLPAPTSPPPEPPSLTWSTEIVASLFKPIARLAEGDVQLAPYAAIMQRLLLDLYIARLAGIPSDTQDDLGLCLRQMRAMLRSAASNDDDLDLAAIGVGRRWTISNRMAATFDAVALALSVDPGAVQKALDGFYNSVGDQLVSMAKSINFRPAFYHTTTSNWPIAEIADALEMFAVDIGVEAAKLYDSLTTVCADDGVVRDFAVVACEAARIVITGEVVKPVIGHLYPDLIVELQHRLEIARRDGRSYLFYHQLLKPLNPPPINDAHLLDINDRFILNEIDNIAARLELRGPDATPPEPFPDVSLPESFHQTDRWRKVLGRDLVLELDEYLHEDFAEVAKIVEQNTKSLRDQMRDLATIHLFMKCPGRDDDHIIAVALAVSQHTAQAIMRMRRNMTVALVATMGRRLNALVNLAICALCRAGRPDCDPAHLSSGLKPGLTSICRSFMNLHKYVDATHSAAEVMSPGLYKALPWRLARGVLAIIEQRDGGSTSTSQAMPSSSS